MPISQKTPIIAVPPFYTALAEYHKFVFYLDSSDWMHILKIKRGIIEIIT